MTRLRLSITILMAISFAAAVVKADSPPYTGPRTDLTRQGPYDPNHLAPVVVRESPGNEATLQRFPDGSIRCYFGADGKAISIRSTDGGVTWSQPQVEFEFEPARHYPRRTLIGRDGEVHMMFFDDATDIYHVKSSGGGRTWGEPKKITNGHIGAIRALTQLPSGRIVLCYHRRVRSLSPPTGSSYTTALYSDDDGDTWIQSDSQITAPVYPNFNGNNYGAVEPTITRLNDGRLWILMRTQTGRLYQSFSTDHGETWSEGEPSIFISSNSPAQFLRLPDGRLLLLWNLCREIDREEFGPVYTNRDVLHAAISDDDGRSWRGFREIFLDPGRYSHKGLGRGDSGTAYPNAVLTPQGKVLVATGQRAGLRGMILFDPQWLYETTVVEDFHDGLKKLNAYTLVTMSKKPLRRPGPAVLPHPDDGTQNVLHFRKRDEHFADALMWNFPLGRAGRVRIELQLRPNSRGLVISLTDHFTYPNDPAGEEEAMLAATVGPNGDIHLPPGQWAVLTLDWSFDRRRCDVMLDGRKISFLSQSNETSTGLCYLRIAAAAEGAAVDLAGALVNRLSAEIKRPGCEGLAE